MQALARVLRWLLKAAVFFTLFAFALNNQQDAVIQFFFGQQARLPMALIVLISFAIGLAVGVLGMLSTLWRKSAARPPAADELPSDRTSLSATQDDHRHGL
jgi:uncharacterized integral membrane protein